MYSDENKNEALKLLKAGEKIVVVATRTLISKSTLYRWKNAAAKKYKMIGKNMLIGKLINQFQEESKVDKSKANNTMQRIKELIDECLKLNPNDIYTLSYAIKAAKLRKNYFEAIRLLKQSLELDPNNKIAIQELDRLQQIRTEEKIKRTKFLFLYDKLKTNGNIDRLEELLRQRILEYPDDLILQNQLAGILLDRLSKNPQNPSLITEIRSILLKLHELTPNNLRINSNLIRLNKLCCNERSMEEILRESLTVNSRNFKAKCQLAQLLIDKCKVEAKAHELNEKRLNEATSLANQVLRRYSNNRYALGQLIEIARLKKDLNTEEALLRRAIELEPDNMQFKTNLAGALIQQCTQIVLRDGKIAKDYPLLIEAKQMLSKRIELEPKNLYVITYLIRVARLQSNITEVINLLKLKVSIDPNDLQAQEDLFRLEEKVRSKSGKNFENTGCKEKAVAGPVPADYFNLPPVKTATPADVKQKEASKTFVTLYSKLMEALDNGWDRQTVSDILNEMLEDESLGENDKKRIHSMIEKTKSTKEKMRFALREQAVTLSKNLY